MGTKNQPGQFDCYAKAEPDEPLFVLLARDEHAPEVVRYWIALKAGIKPVKYFRAVAETPSLARQLTDKLREALTCAKAMGEWRKVNRP